MASTTLPYPVSGTGSGWVLFRTAASLAVDSIRAHKLRSCLTLLGVIIGVASVVLVGSAIEGMGAYADTTTSRVFGSNSFVIQRVAGAGMTRSCCCQILEQRHRLGGKPRDLILQVRNFCRYTNRPAKLTKETLDFAVANYFAVM